MLQNKFVVKHSFMSTPETKKRKADQLESKAEETTKTSEPPTKKQKKEEDDKGKDFNDNYSGECTSLS